MAKTAVHFDADMGSDDAWAIMMALASNKLEVRGISTVFGNAAQEVAARNAISLVEALGFAGIPILHGEQKPIFGPEQMGDDAYGKDGFGGVAFPAPVHSIASGEPLLGHLLNLPDKKVTLVATGPLTNVARTLLQASEAGVTGALYDKVERIIVMGGALRPGPAPVPADRRGNITLRAEFNFFCDPMAANIVLNSGIPCDVLLADATQHVEFTPERQKKLRGLSSPAFGEMATRMMMAAAGLDKEKFGARGTFIHDPQTIVHLLHPDAYTTTRNNRLMAHVTTKPVEKGVPFEQRTHGELHLYSDQEATRTHNLNMCMMPAYTPDRIFGIILHHLEAAGQLYENARTTENRKPEWMPFWPVSTGVGSLARNCVGSPCRPVTM